MPFGAQHGFHHGRELLEVDVGSHRAAPEAKLLSGRIVVDGTHGGLGCILGTAHGSGEDTIVFDGGEGLFRTGHQLPPLAAGLTNTASRALLNGSYNSVTPS